MIASSSSLIVILDVGLLRTYMTLPLEYTLGLSFGNTGELGNGFLFLSSAWHCIPFHSILFRLINTHGDNGKRRTRCLVDASVLCESGTAETTRTLEA
jgi:hypothetical protein